MAKQYDRIMTLLDIYEENLPAHERKNLFERLKEDGQKVGAGRGNVFLKTLTEVGVGAAAGTTGMSGTPATLLAAIFGVVVQEKLQEKDRDRQSYQLERIREKKE